jgi:Rab-GTPase-TBC domain-containing protein
MPDLAKHLVNIMHFSLSQASFGITTSVYATKWYLTLFLGFPFSLATRVWDLFLFYGFDILIMVAVALLKYFEGKLMHLDYEPCMQFLSRLPDTPINDNRLIKLTMQFWKKYAESGKPGRRGFEAFREAFHKEHNK